MPHAGLELAHPRFGDRLVYVATPADSGGRELVCDWHMPAGRRLVSRAHYHPDGPERWERAARG